ncbi:MAG: TolC family protein, partial [Longimicrobiales bacterium]
CRTVRNRTHYVLALVLLSAMPASAQIPPVPERPPAAAEDSTHAEAQLDSLIAIAMLVNPAVHAAQQRVNAAQARIGPAGALPDPMLSVGIMNLPVREPGFSDFMTMKTVGAVQTLPFPGKRTLAERTAELEVRAAEANLESVRRDVVADVRKAWYDLALLDHTLAIMEANQNLLVNFVQVTESRYATGTGGQQDILKAQVETSRLAELAVAVTEQRRAALARLNAVLDRPSDTPVVEPRVPQSIARAAVVQAPTRIRFTSSALGARVADSPFPPLEEMQERAIANSPMVAAHEARIAAQAARVELARKAWLPDLDLSLQYGQRTNRSDMISLMLSVPVPLHKGERQDQQVAEAQAELAAMQAEHHVMVNDLRADLAGIYADVERDRAQLALFVTSIIPQGRASLESALSAFQVGRADFLTLLENQTTLYDYETAWYRALADFAKSVAELERITGIEVLQ